MVMVLKRRRYEEVVSSQCNHDNEATSRCPIRVTADRIFRPSNFGEEEDRIIGIIDAVKQHDQYYL
jgi:hypothetical protein